MADATTELGLSCWLLFLLPAAMSLYVWRPRTPVLVGAAGTLSIATAGFLSPNTVGIPLWLALSNRAIGLVALWAVCLAAQRVIETRIALREQDWMRAGQRDLGRCLEGEQSPETVSERVLNFVCEYLDLPVGSFYLVDAEGRMHRSAGYALGRDAPDTMGPGEGLLGQAVKDRRILRCDDVQPDHVRLTSGLGHSPVRHLVAVPALADGVTNAAFEVGFLRTICSSDMDFLRSLGEPIAIAIRSAQYRERLESLVRQTRQQAESLQVQQEELKVTNEELESQGNALRASQAHLEEQQAELEHTNAKLEEQTQLLERQRADLLHAQSDLMARSQEITRASQYKSEFLANMSHELRTPLNSTLILAKLLADNKMGNLTAEQVKSASTIYAAGNDLLAILNDILDLSRVEAGRLDINPEEVSVGAVLDTLERVFRPVADENGIALSVGSAATTPSSLRTDSLRLQQILRNLLANALKFTPAGEVSLWVSSLDDGRVAFAVRDTGVGIAPAQQEMIFEPFRQADSGVQRSHGGSGLGLTISRQLTQRLGGELTLTSERGKGSTFTLILPTRGPEQGEGPAGPLPVRAAAAAPLPSVTASVRVRPARAPVADDREILAAGERTVLVVEDDQAFAGVLRDVARDQRFRCLVATTAQEALELVSKFTPDAALLDVRLPDGSGMEVLERLKSTATTRHIPVHVISAVDNTQQALEMGAIGYITKPTSREQIVSALDRVTQRLDQPLRRILVVDDNARERDSITALLGADNIEIQSVGSSSEALDQLQRCTFDCMVLDINLAGASGFDVLDEMARRGTFSFPPVIVYTGRALNRDEEVRLRRYASSIIVKGVRSPERLLDEVTLFLHQVEAKLPEQKQSVLRQARNRESVFEDRTILVVEDD
ncbi:MAG TPA: response regulator, partial [Myxococcota bacterium]|nr:response regulator [Myxococcota bacterium]